MTVFVSNRQKCIGIFVSIFLLLSGGWLIAKLSEKESVAAEEYFSMYSGSYALMDGATKRVLAGKEETNPMANASTTKILTCIVTLEQCSLDEIVTISANAAAQPKVHYGVSEGEQYSLEELLYGLMLESFNDCAVAIAEHVAGSVEEFAALLNAKAKEIGCTDTYFITPNGLDAEDEVSFHHTTAEDLCKIMAYCVWESPQKEMFLQITQTRTYDTFVNRNAFLDQMDGVLSGKTGYTSKAGYCYVAALEQDKERYTIALLACGWPNNKTYKWQDAKTLFSYGLENYEVREVTTEEVSEDILVDGYTGRPKFSALNQEGVLHLYGESKTYYLLMTAKEQLRKEYILYENMTLPVKEGEVLGEYHIYLEDVKIDSIPLISTNSGDFWDLKQIFELVITEFISVIS